MALDPIYQHDCSENKSTGAAIIKLLDFSLVAPVKVGQ
jgi:hypothetical protein